MAPAIAEGLIAPESANNGVTSGTLVPLLVLGIPGGATAAIMLVVMQFHGVSFGPSLFENQPKIGYGMFMAMAVAYLLMFLTILPLSRYMSHVTTIPTIYLAPMIISFTLVGGFVPREYMFDMYLALGFGVLGYVARRTGYHVAAILIGIILGPLLERYFLLALKKVGRGHYDALFLYPRKRALGGAGGVADHANGAELEAKQGEGSDAMKVEVDYELARNIRRLGRLDIEGGGQIVVQDGFAYVGHMKPPMGTSIIDVRDPTSPKVVSHVAPPDAWSHTHKVRVVGDIMITNVEQDRRHFLRKGEKLEGLRAEGLSEAEIAAALKVEPPDIAVLEEDLARGYDSGGFRSLGHIGQDRAETIVLRKDPWLRRTSLRYGRALRLHLDRDGRLYRQHPGDLRHRQSRQPD